jgi:hydroxypyruvate reductase
MPATPTRPTSLAALLVEIRDEALARLDAGALVSSALGRGRTGDAVRVLAMGKVAAPMLSAALETLGASALDPLCIAPHGTGTPPGARLVTGGHPHPDAGSLGAGRAVLEWADAAGGSPVLVLLSGGASALACAPAEGLTLEDKLRAAAVVMDSGATIGELNAVRKHLSRLKGGRLAVRLAAAAVGPVLALVLSDVPGDDVSTIGSGPLAPDPTTWDDAARALARPGASGRVPPAVVALAGARLEETPKPGDPRLATVTHLLLAGPPDLARVAAEAARERGLRAGWDRAPLVGDVEAIAARLAAWVDEGGPGPRLLALGGEPTVAVPAGATRPEGGRAQHLALLAARALDGRDAAVLAVGSDGRDGPTEHAGAVVDGGTAARARSMGLDLDRALAEARSGPACAALGAALPRHPPRTHLADLVIATVG